MKKLIRILLSCLILVALSTMFVSCISVNISPGYIDEDKKNGEKEVQIIHDKYNAGKYDEIYNNVSVNFKKTQNINDFLLSMKQTENKFGKFVSVSDQVINVIIGSPIQVRAVFVSQFEKTDVTEIFVFLKEGNELKLFSYQASKGAVSLDEVKQDLAKEN